MYYYKTWSQMLLWKCWFVRMSHWFSYSL